MERPSRSRKALFTAAIKLEGITVEQWCTEQPNEKSGGTGVSTAHLYEVLNEKSTSAPLTARIDALIQRHFPEVEVAEPAA